MGLGTKYKPAITCYSGYKATAIPAYLKTDTSTG
jgi:hypothetical protein